MAHRKRGASRRHPAESGYARGEQKRGKIIEAAIGVFGAVGFDGATTRSIAQRAGVPPTALQYYFGGKEGLYAACDAHIAEQAAARLYPILLEVTQTLQVVTCSSRDIGRIADELTDKLIEFLCGSSQTESWVLFVVRSELGEGGRSKSEQFKRHIVNTLSSVVARALSRSPADAGVVIRALAIYGAIVSFRLMQGLVLRSLEWEAFGPRRLPVLQEEFRALVHSMLQ